MKILAEVTAGKFDVNEAARKAVDEIKALRKGTLAEGAPVPDHEVFLHLATKYPAITFVLLDNDGCVIGWRNN